MHTVERDAVVILDDDPAVLASLEFLLQASGYEVVAYASPVAFLRDGVGRAACLIVDQQMPHMTGLDVISRLRAEERAMPALLVSSSLTPVVRARAENLGVGTLAKPLEEDDLLRFVAAHARPAAH
jgi:two-component system, LuxR family, response regulator FixJ